jgi:hypothetical protein
MSEFGKELRMYAESGLRTADAWLSLGRQVSAGTPPRVKVDLRGQVVPLFSKDQTALFARPADQP